MAGCDCDDIGSRSHRVTIEKPGGTAGDDGLVDLTLDSNWTQLGKRWAGFKTRGGAEGRRFNQVGAEITHLIDMTYDTLTRQIVPSWRLRKGSRKFNITAAYDVDEAHRTVLVHATEVV